MLEVLKKINFPTPSSIKRSGDIKMWIYLETRTGGRCVGLSLHPSLTAGTLKLISFKSLHVICHRLKCS
jgi:hypothetical protein